MMQMIDKLHSESFAKPSEISRSAETTENPLAPPYNLNEARRFELGRDRQRFEEWENLSFDEFAGRAEFQSAEAVVGYFLDHPQVHIQDALVNLLMDGKYEDFITTHFDNKTKLNPRGLAFELEKVVTELASQKKALQIKVAETVAIGDEALKHHMGFAPVFDERKTLFVPSADIYNYLAHGVSTASLKRLEGGSEGMTARPKIEKNQEAPINFNRISYVPLAFELKIDTTKLEITSSTKMPTNYDELLDWHTFALLSANHEIEHTRVIGKYDKEEDTFDFGFMNFANPGNLIRQDREKERRNYWRDEAMTEFIAVWKLLLSKGQLQPTDSIDQIVVAIKASNVKGKYLPLINQLVIDMKTYQERFQIAPLEDFLRNYYFSSEYPVQ